MFSRCVALVLGVGRRPLAAVVVSAVFVAVALAGSQGARTAVEATSGAAVRLCSSTGCRTWCTRRSM
jgi:hypothetical protein